MKLAIQLAAAMLLAAANGALSQTNDINSARPKPPSPAAAAALRLFDPPTLSILTDAQRESLAEKLSGSQEQVRSAHEKIRSARQDLVASSLGGKFDEAAVRAKALELANAEAELTVLRMKALSEVQPPFTPQQIRRLQMTPAAQRLLPSRLPENRPDRQRILQGGPRDVNNLPPKR